MISRERLPLWQPFFVGTHQPPYTLIQRFQAIPRIPETIFHDQRSNLKLVYLYSPTGNESRFTWLFPGKAYSKRIDFNRPCSGHRRSHD